MRRLSGRGGRGVLFAAPGPLARVGRRLGLEGLQGEVVVEVVRKCLLGLNYFADVGGEFRLRYRPSVSRAFSAIPGVNGCN